MHAGLGALADLGGLALGLLNPVVRLGARAGGDLLRRLVGALEDAASLLAHLGHRVLHGGLGRAADLKLRHQAVHALDVGVHGLAVITAHGAWE